MDKILTDKNYKDYNYFSRYTSYPYYYHNIDKKYIYGTPTQLNKTITYMIYKVKKNDTLDSIALNYYNNPTLFWAIADFNSIQDPYIKLTVGQELKIPTLSELSFGDY